MFIMILIFEAVCIILHAHAEQLKVSIDLFLKTILFFFFRSVNRALHFHEVIVLQIARVVLFIGLCVLEPKLELNFT